MEELKYLFSFTFPADLFYSLFDAFEVPVSHVVGICKVLVQIQYEILK